MQSQPQVTERRKRTRTNTKGSDKLQRLIEELCGCEEERFTGYIKVNYSQGSIARVEKFEEILRK